MKKTIEQGNRGFPSTYWHKNYPDPQEMDGVGNAREHARFISAHLTLENIPINSIIDFGAGLGAMFKAVVEEIRPNLAVAVEPSPLAWEQLKKVNWKEKSLLCELRNEDMLTCLQFFSAMATQKKSWRYKKLLYNFNNKVDYAFDLGICNSVFQYLSDREVDLVLALLAKRCRFVYFTVPT